MAIKLKQIVARLVWPAGLTLLGVLLHFGQDLLLQGPSSELARLATGSLTYFASAWFLARVIGVALERASTKRQPVPRLLPEMISAALFIAALIATLMLILGYSVSGAVASSGLVLAVLGFAIRNIVADALSGVALGLEGPYRIGDWVSIDGVVEGRIVEIGWRTTRLQTTDSTYWILPNSQIARQKVTNYSAPQRRYRAQVQVVLPHLMPVDQAKRILAEAAASSPLVDTSPAPDARAIAFKPHGIVYAVRYWVSNFSQDSDCRDSVLSQIDSALRQHNVPRVGPCCHWTDGNNKADAPYAMMQEAAG